MGGQTVIVCKNGVVDRGIYVFGIKEKAIDVEDASADW